MESLRGGTGTLNELRLRQTVEHLWTAGAQDPLARRALRGCRSPQALEAHLADAFERLARDGEAAVLTPEQIGSLEAISVLVDRPALLIRDGSFQVPGGAWSRLAAHVQDLRSFIPSVGQLSVAPACGGVIGTGFVVGERLVMSNRHVLDFLYTPEGDAGRLHDDVSMKIDFKREHGSPASAVFDITAVRKVFPESSGIDLALLEVRERGHAGEPLPAPLLLQSDPAVLRTGAAVCVIGYPQADPERNDEDEMDRIFEQVYGCKRLAPGFVTEGARQGSFAHDCSTLGGNSGSCVIDLDSASVIGLHWGGDYLAPNHAVSLPGVAQALDGLGLNFGTA